MGAGRSTREITIMTTLALSPSTGVLRFNAPVLNPVLTKSAVKIGTGIAIFVAVVTVAYLVLPRLGTQGIWAYGVGFLVQATTSASIVVPIPGMAALVVMSQETNLIWLAMFGAAGGAIGELFGYWIGSQGRGPLASSRLFSKLETAMRRRGGIVIFLFALVPVLPMDAAGIVAGATRYPLGRYLAAMFAGKVLLLLAAFLAARELVSGLSFLNGWLA